MAVDLDQPADMSNLKPADADIVSQHPANERTVRTDLELFLDALVPPGVIQAYGGATAPNGYLLCDGQAVSRTTFARLFAVVSTLYGVGDGSTTFNVPDMRGRVPLGQDDMGGTPANRVTDAAADVVGGTGGGEISDSQGAHQHGVTGIAMATAGAHNHGGATAGNVQTDTADGSVVNIAASPHTHDISSDGGHVHNLSGNVDSAGAHTHNIVQHYQTHNYIIRT